MMDVSFNQDVDCVCAVHGARLAVFSLAVGNEAPSRRSLRLASAIATSTSDILLAQMLHRTNLIAVVLAADKCKLYLFDDIKNRSVVHLDFRYPVLAVRLRRDSIIVLTLRRLYIYSLGAIPVKLYESDIPDSLLPTSSPSFHFALLTCSSAPDRAVVCLLARQKGHIQYIDYSNLVAKSTDRSSHITRNENSSAGSGKSRSKEKRKIPDNGIIKAHDGEVRVVSTNYDGTLVATASDRGTLIRVWDIASGRLVVEFRRGTDSAEIYSIEFNRQSTRIVVSSDKGTIHVFNMPSDETSSSINSQQERSSGRQSNSSQSSNPSTSNLPSSSFSSLPSTSNTRSSLSFLAPLIPLPSYFSSEWSFASLKLAHRTRHYSYHHHNRTSSSPTGNTSSGGGGNTGFDNNGSSSNLTPTIGPATRLRTVSASSSSSGSLLSSSPLVAATTALLNVSSSSLAAQQLAHPIRAIAAFDGSDSSLNPSTHIQDDSPISPTSVSSSSSSSLPSPLPSLASTFPSHSGNDKIVTITDDGEVWKWSFDKWRGGEGVVDHIWRISLDPDDNGVMEL